MSRRRSSSGPGCSGWTASTCSTPTAEPFDRFVIRHPGAVTVVPVHDDGTVTLVRQYRAAVDALVLEIPAGTRDKDGEEPGGHGPAGAGRGGRAGGRALGAAHRDLEHAGDQRPAHADLPGHRPHRHARPGPTAWRRAT